MKVKELIGDLLKYHGENEIEVLLTGTGKPRMQIAWTGSDYTGFETTVLIAIEEEK